MNGLGRPSVRAVVYTRKSSEEGLEQEFNSLDAQYEACTAYISSQRHEGWKLVKQRFDDGGVSGGTMDRPALKALLDEIDKGLIDMIVVYKIDRLTRSLSDFARLIERLEKAGCSFVSVTQSFNTSSSMGRLTLNVLLSFAQFEREVTAERIRDKIAASKKKGMWMGGVVPWGYQVHPDPKIQSLEPHVQNAPDIQRIFDLYERLGCLSKLKRDVDQLWPARSYSRGRLHNILRNPIYIGKVRHKAEVYEGLHDAIIDQDQFDRVQEQMQLRSIIKRGTHHSRGPSAYLVGKVFDETGDRLTPSKTKKNGRTIRYYYSNRLTITGADPTGWRLRADMLEETLHDILKLYLKQTLQKMQLAPLIKSHALIVAIEALNTLSIEQTLNLIERVDLSDTLLIIKLRHDTLAQTLNINTAHFDHDYLSFKETVTFRRRSNGTKMVWADYKSEPNHALIRAIAQSRIWVDKLKAGESVTDITTSEGISESRLWKRIRLAFLSPKLVKAILDGTTGQELTIKKLSAKEIPLTWAEQHARFLN